MSKLAERIIHRTQFLHTAGRALRSSDLGGEELPCAERLCEDGKLVRSHGLYHLPDFDELVSVDYSFRETQNALLRKVRSKLWVLRSLPFVQDVALCNTLSFGTADRDSDIDLFIILDSSRFYTARLITSLLFHISGSRRHGDKIASRFCLSFFVSDSTLELEDVLIEDDIYFYYWFYHLVFLKGNSGVQRDLLQSNSWFEEDSFSFKNMNTVTASWFARGLEVVLGSPLFDWFEWLQQRVQMSRIKKKQLALSNPKGVVIEDKFFKFHVKDAREEFKARFYSRSQRSLLK